MYGIDLMLAWSGAEGSSSVEPRLLEVNFMPDCERACVYYPDFATATFAALFGPDHDPKPHEDLITRIV